jgi:molybdopterin/thiamine biosynthesis adenylyltransferase
MTRRNHILIVGLGNIGSFLAPLLARLDQVSELTLIDPDKYSGSNIKGQNIDRRFLGRNKAVAQASLVRKIRPDLAVNSLPIRVEHSPIGPLRADIICSCVDSKIARMYCNELAYQLGGIPFVDAGVSGSQSLARVSVFESASSSSCLECAWNNDDYQSLEIAHPCRSGESSAFPTNAPSFLGALAASLSAAECSKIMSEDRRNSLFGKQTVIGLEPHIQWTTAIRRNPACRFNHAVWDFENSVERGVDEPLWAFLDDSETAMSVPRATFTIRRQCASCGHSARLLSMIRTGQAASSRCAKCGGVSNPTPFDYQDRLSRGHLTNSMLSRTLRSIGMLPGDLISYSSPIGDRLISLSS